MILQIKCAGVFCVVAFYIVFPWSTFIDIIQCVVFLWAIFVCSFVLRLSEPNRIGKLTTLILFSVNQKFFCKYLMATRRNYHFLGSANYIVLLFKIPVTEAYRGIYRHSYSTFIWDTSCLSAGTTHIFYHICYIIWLLYISYDYYIPMILYHMNNNIPLIYLY